MKLIRRYRMKKPVFNGDIYAIRRNGQWVYTFREPFDRRMTKIRIKDTGDKIARKHYKLLDFKDPDELSNE